MRVAIADPPYPGCAHLYKDHVDYGGEVDHNDLCARLVDEYDGFVLHTSSPALYDVETLLRKHGCADYRVMPWVKTFAAFKRNVSVAYAWEPCIVKPCRKPVVDKSTVYRDWYAAPMTMKKGLTGVKPADVCRWLFAVVGLEPEDEMHDLYPGTGAITDAWNAWRTQLVIV